MGHVDVQCIGKHVPVMASASRYVERGTSEYARCKSYDANISDSSGVMTLSCEMPDDDDITTNFWTCNQLLDMQ